MASIQSLSFFPTSISGCSLWLDGADPSSLIFSGAGVSQWTDKSSAGNTATQSVSSNRPTYSGRTLVYSGSNFLNLPNGTLPIGSGAFSLFMTASVTNTSNVQYLFGAGNGVLNQALNIYTDGNTMNLDVFGTRARGTFTFTSLTLLEFFFGSSTLTIYVNGTSNASQGGVTKSTGTSNNSLGASTGSSGGSQLFMTGTMGETLLYTSVVTTTQREQIEGYLAWKWGLQGSLPTTHPYYYMPPNSQGLPVPPLIRSQMTPRAFGSASLPLAFFNPTSIGNCILWLDAADSSKYTLSGSSLVSWLDKSSSGYTCTPVSGNVITTSNVNGLNVFFLNSTRLNIPSFVWSFQYTLFFVTRTANASFLYSQQTGGGYSNYVFTGNDGLQNINNTLTLRDSVIAQGTPVVSSNVYSIFSIGYSSGTSASNYAVNGTTRSTSVLSGTAVSPGSATSLLYINGNLGGAVDSTYIAEILQYNTSITTAQRQQIEGYLAWKWGLQGSLPVSHPFKTSIPGLTLNVPIFASGMQNGSFSPARISGNTLWLDSQDPYGTGVAPASNTKLGTWFDKSGAGRNATQTTTAQQPTYIGNGVSFVGTSSNFLNMSDAYNMLNASGRTYTTFVVEKRGSSNTTQFFFAGSTANNAIFFGYNDNTTMTHTAAVTSDSLYTVAGWANPDPVRIWGGGYSGAVRNIVLNGTEVTFGTYTGGPIAGWSNAFIGYITLASINTYYTGTIYEMLFYNSYLSLNQRQQVEGYLAWKWGLQGNLPVTHPFKKFPPPPN